MTASPAPLRILVVDDDDDVRRSLQRHLSNEGHRVDVAADGQQALTQIEGSAVDVVLTDMRMPRMDGNELLRRVLERWPGVAVIVVTAFGDIPSAVEAMRQGAFDYLTKPFDVEHLAATLGRVAEVRALRRENERLRDRMARLGSLGRQRYGLEAIVGTSPGLAAVRDQIVQVSASPATTVLIQGETGTGKELVARAVHYESERRDGPFVAVDCSAVPDTLVEASFYGHEAGAFTGADEDRMGHFEAADGGTLFLDEVGDMDAAMQARLLRTLEERSVMRLGSSVEVPVDVRVVSATNQDLDQAVDRGGFREDLLYRLNTFAIRVPPLRERPEDIGPLAHHFLRRFAAEQHRAVTDFAPGALEALAVHRLPGNVRELRNRVEHAVIVCETDAVSATDLGVDGAGAEAAPSTLNAAANQAAPAAFEPGDDLNLAHAERLLIERALDRVGGRRGDAADLLGISRDALRRRMIRLGLTP